MSCRPLAVAVLLLFAAVAAEAQTMPLDPNIPDVAECHGLLTQALLDHVRGAKSDPGKDFEQWRRGRRTLIETPPAVECQSKLWRALRHTTGLFNMASVPAESDALDLVPADRDLQRQLRAYAASVGSNLDPAGGQDKYQGEVQIAVNPNNPQQLVAASNSFYRDPAAECQSPTGGTSLTDGTQALYGSTDGGATWTYKCAPWPSGLTGGVPGAAYFFGSDPAVAWDAQGHAYAAYMLLSEDGFGYSISTAIVLYRSSDSGATWSYAGTIVNHLNNWSILDDKEFITIDNGTSATSHPGRIYAIWDANNVERVAHSDDGATWTTVILPTPSFGSYDIGGDVKVAPDGTVYAIWSRLWNNTGESIVFSKSTDGGNTWTTPVIVVNQRYLSFSSYGDIPAQDYRGINGFGSIDIDANPASAYYGSIYVGYTDYPAGFTFPDTNVYVTRSTDGGATWSAGVKVNDDSGTASQFFPWMSVDPTDGTVNVSWYDTRADSLNRNAQRYYARSSNGGVSFEPNILVTDNGGAWVNKVNYSDENSSTNSQVNANQYGDYSGIVAFNRQVHPFWTDSRQFYPATGDTRAEDSATATIVNCSAAAAVAAPSVAFAGSCVVGVTLNWSAPSAWGTNATGGTYSVYRSTSATLAANASPIVSGLTTTTYTDTTGTVGTTYYYFVAAKNNCPGTALTPMSSLSPASSAILFSNGVTASVTGSAPICIGNSTVVSATLTGTPPWNITWSDGFSESGLTVSPATHTVTPSSTTTYTVTAISNASCSGTPIGAAVVTVNTPPDVPTISAGSPTTFCQGNSVTLTSSAAAGNQWLKDGVAIIGATNATYSATVSGSYTVEVTVAGCGSKTSAPTTVTVNANLPSPSISAGGPIAFCEGSSVTLTSSAEPNYQWLKDGVPIGGATSSSYVASISGSYTVQATNSDNCASTSAAVVVIASPVPVTPTITTTGATDFCDGSSITLTASASSGYQWFQDGVAISGATNQNYVATKAGNYSVEAVAPGCTSAMSGLASVTVKPTPAAPNVSASGPLTFCSGGSITLTSDNPTGIQWFKDGVAINGATNATLAVTASGSYTATSTGANGCTSPPSAAQVVVVNPIPPLPKITAGGPTTVCGGPVVLTSSNATGNQWYKDGVAISGATGQSYSATASGSYTVITAWLSCSSATSTAVPVTINPKPDMPTITAGGPTSFCQGGSVTLTSSSATGNQWYSFGSPISGATSQNYIVTSYGDYSVAVSNGTCTSTMSNTVLVQVTYNPNPPSTFTYNSPNICAGGSVALSTYYAIGVQWFLNGTAIPGATEGIYLATVAGSYTATVTHNGCTSAQSSPPIVVTVSSPPAKPTITAPTTSLCPGASITLTSSAAPGYQWLLLGGQIYGQTSQTLVVSSPGIYSVQAINGGCAVSSDPVEITMLPQPSPPTLAALGPTTFCPGGSVTLNSTAGTSYVWMKNGTVVSGSAQSYVATDTGSYTVAVTNASGCLSPQSNAVNVTVQPPFLISAQSATTVCGTSAGVALVSNDGKANQWYRDGAAIPGAIVGSYLATTSGSYTATSSVNGCPSNAIAVHINEGIAPPSIAASGPTAFCGSSGAVTLSTAAASSYQWFRDGNAIAGATSQSFATTTAGAYVVQIVNNGCTSPYSSPVSVSFNNQPDATITAPAVLLAGTAGTASVASMSGATYSWSTTNALTGDSHAASLSFTPAAAGPVTLTVTVTRNGCSDTKMMTVTALINTPGVSISAIAPAAGPIAGGTPFKITGTGFAAGAVVSFDSIVATSIVVVDSKTITGVSPAHVLGNANVIVTNPDKSGTALLSGFAFQQGLRFDPNGDNIVDPADIFYLVNYLFMNGPAPRGWAGVLSGDANNDGVVDPADIFYTVNYLFMTGPKPLSTGSISGSISLGTPVHRDGRTFIPVIVTTTPDSAAPQSIALKLRGHVVAIRRAGVTKDLDPLFETAPPSAWLASFDAATAPIPTGTSVVVAEVEAEGAVEIDPAGTMLCNQSGTRSAGSQPAGAPAPLPADP